MINFSQFKCEVKNKFKKIYSYYFCVDITYWKSSEDLINVNIQ